MDERPDRTPEENYDLLKSAVAGQPNDEAKIVAAQAFVATLSKRERIELNAVNEDLKMGVLLYPNTLGRWEFPPPHKTLWINYINPYFPWLKAPMNRQTKTIKNFTFS